MGLRLRLGMLTPSSNTVLEPVTYDLLRGLDGVTAHFARFEVTRISLDAAGLAQFDPEPILTAARLLAHAKCDVIAWNGTSASWLGFEQDEALVRSIERETGIPAATCVLAYRDLFQTMNVKRFGLVTPYTQDVQDRIVDNWARSGFACSAERHCGISDNFAFAELAEARIEAMVRAVVPESDAVAIVCTNMRGWRVASQVQRETGTPVLDSVVVTLWAALQRVGAAHLLAPTLAGHGRNGRIPT